MTVTLDRNVEQFIGAPRQLFINGQWADAASGKTFATPNPATGETLANIAEGDAEDIDRAVRAARRAFEEGPWSKMTPSERGRIIWRIGDLILEHTDELAQLESLDNGKPFPVAQAADVPLAADLFHYMAGGPPRSRATRSTFGSTATTCSTRRCRSAGTSSPAGAVRWATRCWRLTPRSRPSPRSSDQAHLRSATSIDAQRDDVCPPIAPPGPLMARGAGSAHGAAPPGHARLPAQPRLRLARLLGHGPPGPAGRPAVGDVGRDAVKAVAGRDLGGALVAACRFAACAPSGPARDGAAQARPRGGSCRPRRRWRSRSGAARGGGPAGSWARRGTRAGSARAATGRRGRAGRPRSTAAAPPGSMSAR